MELWVLSFCLDLVDHFEIASISEANKNVWWVFGLITVAKPVTKFKEEYAS